MGRKSIPPVDPNNLTLQERQRIASQKWKEKNREKSKEKCRQYRKDHPEYFKQKKQEEMEEIRANPAAKEAAYSSRKRSYKKHRLKRIAHQKEYADSHVEELKEYRQRTSDRRLENSRKWRAANPERWKETSKKWRQANMHVIRKHIALRRAREVSATIGDPRQISAWEKEWKSRPTNICEWCRMETPSELCQTDHAEPLTRGGSHSLDNLVIACEPCNRRKKNKPLSKWLDILGAEP